MQNYNSKLKIIAALVINFILLPAAISAAQLYFEPAGGAYRRGDTFIVDAKIDSGDECINALEVNLNFPQDILEAIDFSQGGSILIIWLEKPTLNQSAGLISFTGGIPGGYCGPLPGDPGKSSLLGRIVFRARQTGADSASGTQAELKFLESSQVYLNDGLGNKAKLASQEAVFTILPEKSGAPKDDWKKELARDTMPPEPFEIEIGQDASIFGGKYFIIFSTTDKQTGVDYYEVQEGRRIEKAQSPYLLKDQSLRNVIKVKAVDKAGNERTAELAPRYPPEAEKPFSWLIVVILIIAATILWFVINKKSRRIIWSFCALIFAFYILLTDEAHGASASLYLLPSTGTYTVGNTFLTQVKINSGGMAINAADGVMVFDTDDLEVKNISKENSVFSMWVQEPAFSNSLGTIDFAGGKPSPGFTGAAGVIFTVTFKIKTAGTAIVAFASGSVLADDGKGTNVLGSLGSAAYTLLAKEIAPPQSPVAPAPVSSQAPTPPVVSSPAADTAATTAFKAGNFTTPNPIGLSPFLKLGKMAIDYLSITATLIILVIILIFGVLAIIFYARYRILMWQRMLKEKLAAFRALLKAVAEQIEYLEKKAELTKDEKNVLDRLKKSLEVSKKFIEKIPE